MYDLTKEEVEKIKEILKNNFPNSRALVFGSRQKGNNKKHSDIDIAIDTNETIDWEKIESIKEEFMNSSLRIRVEIIDFNSVSGEFRKIILSDYSVLKL